MASGFRCCVCKRARHLSTATGGLPRPHLLGRVNSAALAWRQRAGPKTARGGHSLSVSHMSA
eukprot:2393194-Amphidinium_carterae.1